MRSHAQTLQPLGKSTVQVSSVCLGGNRFGSSLDQNQSERILDAFVERGGNFIDTALVYADWIDGIERSCSERTLGRWIAKDSSRQSLVVATKGGHPSVSAPAVSRLDPQSLRADASRSVENLGSPIALYYLHRDDPSRPVGEILQTLEDLVSDGMIRSYAACNFSAARLDEAHLESSRHGWRGFAAHQAAFSLAAPAPGALAPGLVAMDADLRRLHTELQLPVIAYSAQAKGFFDKIETAADPNRPSDDSIRLYDTDRNRKLAAAITGLAGKYEATSTQIALAALTLDSLQVVPIIGCRTIEQLESSMDGLYLEFDDADRALLRQWLSYPSDLDTAPDLDTRVKETLPSQRVSNSIEE